MIHDIVQIQVPDEFSELIDCSHRLNNNFMITTTCLEKLMQEDVIIQKPDDNAMIFNKTHFMN